jgi:hypothetical protein
MKKCLLTLLLAIGLSFNAPVSAQWLQNCKIAVVKSFCEAANKLQGILKSLFKMFNSVRVLSQDSRQQVAAANSSQPAILLENVSSAGQLAEAPQDPHKDLFYPPEQEAAQKRLLKLLQDLAPDPLKKPVQEHKS